MKRIASYKFKSRLEVGGMRGSYIARFGLTKADERDVAVKVIRLSEGVSREARSELVIGFSQRLSHVTDIRHPDIVGLLDGGYDDPWLFIVQELVEAPSLSDLLAAGGVTYTRAYAIILGIAGALARAHEAGIFHSGISPETVLVTPKGPRLMEFGLRWALENIAVIDDEDSIPGCPALRELYFSPEHFTGTIDETSDVFSLGSLIFALLGLGSPWRADDRIELGRLIREGPAPLLKSAGPLGQLAAACLQKDKRSRPTAAEIEQWLGG